MLSKINMRVTPNGSLLMTVPFRSAVVLALCLLVAACGGGGPAFPGSSPEPLPAPPGSFTATLTPNGEAMLSWTAPAPSPSRLPVTGYEAYVETANGRAVRIYTGGALTHTHRGLSPGTRYVYHVRALNAAGRSGPSPSAVVDVPRGPTLPPEAPGNFSAELTPTGEVMFQWTAPSPSPVRVPVTGYAVYRELPSGRAELLGTSESFAYLHPRLRPSARYVFHVRAMSVLGLSQPSAAAFLDLLENLPPFPEAPGSFTAELTANKEALLSWAAPPPSPDRSPVTGYVVYRELPGGTFEELAEIADDSLSYRYRGLMTGIRYVFHVRAVSAVGLSGPSASASVEVTEGFPPFPDVPGSFTAELTVNKEALLSWTAPPPSADRSPVTGYAVYRELADGTAVQLTETHADSLTYVYSGLVVGTRYVFHVRALSAVGPSRLSGSASVEVMEGLPPFPEAPGSFTAELTVNKEAQLSWTAPPPSADRSPVTGVCGLPGIAWRDGPETRGDRCRFVVVRVRQSGAGDSLRISCARGERCRSFGAVRVGVGRGDGRTSAVSRGARVVHRRAHGEQGSVAELDGAAAVRRSGHSYGLRGLPGTG